MPAAPSEDFLKKKAGPLPVWAWAGLGLGGAYAYSRYRASKTAAAASSSSASTTAGATAAEPTQTSPYYVIENNEPGGVYGSGSTNSNPATGTATVSPPGTTTSPPVQIQGGNPPHGTPTPATHTATVTPGTVLQIPVAVQGGKTVASLAKEFGISTQHLLSNNPGLTASASNTVINVPYLVKSGDTVNSIASKFMISPAHLQLDLNTQPGAAAST